MAERWRKGILYSPPITGHRDDGSTGSAGLADDLAGNFSKSVGAAAGPTARAHSSRCNPGRGANSLLADHSVLTFMLFGGPKGKVAVGGVDRQQVRRYSG